MSISAFVADMSVNPFLVTGTAAGLLASVSCGVMGPSVVARRIVFLAGAIAHAAVGGVGAAIFLRTLWPSSFGGLTPLIGALGASLVAALALAALRRGVDERLDTLIGALWAVGMATGLLLVKFTPGYQGELVAYLFGNLALVSWSDVGLLALIALLVVATSLVFHKRFLGFCLDPEQAELQGLHPFFNDAVHLLLVALTVISLTQVVGLILVIALLSLPAATAALFQVRLAGMMVTSVVLCGLLTLVPRMVVYGTRVSPEAAVVIAAAGLYLAAALVAHLRRRTRGPAPSRPPREP